MSGGDGWKHRIVGFYSNIIIFDNVLVFALGVRLSNGIPVPLLNPSVVQSVPSCTNQFCFFLQGIVKALQEYQKSLLEHKVSIFVRRGGPNYQEGLRVMREIGDENHTRNCN